MLACSSLDRKGLVPAGGYASCAALYCWTSAADNRPRAGTSIPWLTAHARTSRGDGTELVAADRRDRPRPEPLAEPPRPADLRRPALAGRAAPPTCRACSTQCAKWSRSCAALSADRSISYWRPSTAKAIASAAGEPSTSSVQCSITSLVRAMVTILPAPGRKHSRGATSPAVLGRRRGAEGLGVDQREGVLPDRLVARRGEHGGHLDGRALVTHRELLLCLPWRGVTARLGG